MGGMCIKIGTLLQASLSQDTGYLETRASVRARTKGPNPTPEQQARKHTGLIYSCMSFKSRVTVVFLSIYEEFFLSTF